MTQERIDFGPVLEIGDAAAELLSIANGIEIIDGKQNVPAAQMKRLDAALGKLCDFVQEVTKHIREAKTDDPQ